MRISKGVLGCIAAAAIFAGGSSLPAYAQTAPSVNMAWGGPYVGAYTGRFFVNTIVGLRAGYNFTFGQWVASAEAGIGMITNGGGVVGEVTARARIGALVRPRFLAYASATLGYIPYLTIRYLGLGGGLEFAVADDFSIFTEMGFANTFSVPGAIVYQLGVHWHP